MRILILGYGKMGKTIEKVALERSHKIVGKINADNAETLQNFDTQNTDVAIEFSQPEVAYQNINYCLKKNIPVVSGTTGWIDKLAELEKYCQAENATFFYASNFSIAVNMFFIINEKLAKLMSPYPEYDVKMEEIHHIHKKDEPSGTAISLAQGIIENHAQKESWTLNPDPKTEELGIEAKREGEIRGTHIVTYKSDLDTLTLSHEAHDRRVFALGAVLSAEWVKDKKGVFGMRDMLNTN
jgi:4-hydroxy-tetrahydrodipicolinate reductase